LNSYKEGKEFANNKTEPTDIFPLSAKTFRGFEEVLSIELGKLGARNIRTGNRIVFFEGDLGFLYKCNLQLRTALRVLLPIRECRLRGPHDLYKQIHDIDWTRIFDSEKTFRVDCTLRSELFDNSLFAAQKAKDAIADRFRKEIGSRPNVDTGEPDLRIHIHINEDALSITLDSSGASLHHRGYRTLTNIAPINEVLAAGLIMLSGWEGDCDFMDSMCGSGTFLIEATQIACRIPASIHRPDFAFMHWKDYDSELFERIHEGATSRIRDIPFKIFGYDKAPSAVRKTLENIRNAGLESFVEVGQKDFFQTTKPTERHLHLLTNPPYGERLNIDTKQFYTKLGDTLKQGYPDTDAWLITGNLDAVKYMGLRPSRKIKVFNGKIESRLLFYPMYRGSKKAKHQSETPQ